MVRTPGFHPGNGSSILPGVTDSFIVVDYGSIETEGF